MEVVKHSTPEIPVLMKEKQLDNLKLRGSPGNGKSIVKAIREKRSPDPAKIANIQLGG